LSRVELTRVSSPTEAAELQFLLVAAGIEAELGHDVDRPGEATIVLVDERQLDQARAILAEESGPAAEPRPSADLTGPHPGLYWVIGLLVVDFVIWWVMESRGGSESRAVLLRFGASHAPSVLRAGEWWRLLSAVFLHIGAQHLIANMATLLVFGPWVLRAWGPGRFYFIYLLTGVAGNAASLALAPSASVKAGASGAILGLLGALAGLRIRRLHQPGPPSRFKTWHVVAMVLAFYGFVVGVGPADHLAHLGGLICGAILAFVLPTRGQLRPGADRALDLTLGIASVALALAAGLLAYRVS